MKDFKSSEEAQNYIKQLLAIESHRKHKNNCYDVLFIIAKQSSWNSKKGEMRNVLL